MINVLKKIWDFSEKEQGNILKSILVGVLNAIFNALQISAIFVTINAVIMGNGEKGVAVAAFTLMLASVLGKIITQYFSQLQQTHAGYFMVGNRRVEIGNKLKSVPMGYFSDNNLGKITGVSTTVLTDVETTAPMVLVLILGGLLNSLIFAISTFFFDVRIGIIIIASMLVFLMATSLQEKKSRVNAPKRQIAQEKLVGAVLEYIQGMSVVKAFNLNNFKNKRVDNAIDESCKCNYEMGKVITPYMILQNSLLKLASVAVILVSILFYIDGSMELVYCIMMIIVSFLIFDPIEGVGHSSSILRVTSSSIDMANELNNVPVMEEGKNSESILTTDIEFNNVSFSYEKQQILNDINLRIPERTTTAIIGPSGSGKTTICNLIARFWDVDSGSITIGGKDIRKLSLHCLMDSISMVFQNVYLFEDTIENNIKFGKPNASRQQVIDAAKRASCHEFILELPNGYDTIIGEGGASLSGGEKQRVSIARAILKDAPIIIFDEATANVDPENEDRLQKAIEELTKDKTIIMIAHRLKTVKHADQILVINNGKIEQRGKHDELINKEGIYKNFVCQRKEVIGWKVK